MALNLDVTVNLTGGTISGTLSEHFPLIIVPNTVTGRESTAAVPYTECTSLNDVVAAGFSTDSKLYKAVKLMLSQAKKPKKFAICGSTATTAAAAVTSVLNKDWRQIITVALGEEETIADVAALIETTEDKVYFTSIAIEGWAAMAAAALGTAWKTATSALAAYDRTVIMFYDNSVQTPEAALVGASAGYAAGSFTYKNLILKGIAPLNFTSATLTVLTNTDGAAKGITVVKKAGDIVTSEGKVASGEYIDIIDSYDWIIEHIGYYNQKVFNVNPKVPFTNAGIAQLEAATLSVLKEAFDNGMIAEKDENANEGEYATNFLPAADISADDKANRHYSGGNFSFKLAGAIHTAEINGTIAA